jgi:hypothetical protein
MPDMPVNDIYYEEWNFYEDPGSGSGSTYSFSEQLNIPSQTLYASAALSYVTSSRGGGMAYCGISSYSKGGSTVHPTTAYNGVAPAIFDSNVDSVVFGLGVYDAEASCALQIFGFG